MTAPTVDDILQQTASPYLSSSGETMHTWHDEGGAMLVLGSELRSALESAYEPNMPDWVSLISYDSEDGFHVA
jgi:hypothetical protein